MIFEYKKGSLILLSGIPGCGKSTFAKKHFPKDYIISTDEIRERYFGDEHKFNEDGTISIGNYETNGALIFSIVMKIANERCAEGLSTVIDATNLRDSDRKRFITLGNWERIYTIIFDSEKALEQNKIRKEKNIRGYVPEKIIEKMSLSFNKGTSIKNNNIIKAEKITEVKERFDNLNLSEENNILVYGDVHGMKDFYETYKTLQEKYTKNYKKPLSVFVGDLVDRGNHSVDNLCFIMNEVKKGDAKMVMGNHELKLLRNINKFLEEGVIEDFVEARYNTIKQFVELHKKDGIYDGFIKEIKGENFNLHRIKNFLDSLPFYKTITTGTRKKYLVTHSPLLVPENTGNLKKSIAIFGSEQLKENLYIKQEEANKNNTNFIKATKEVFKKTGVTCITGHIELQDLIDKLKIKNFYSLEGEVDRKGFMKVLVLEKNGKKITGKIEKFESDIDFNRGQTNTGEYKNFCELGKDLIHQKHYGDLTIFKYSKKVFYKNLWLKNSNRVNNILLKARGIVFDRLGNIVSYPFDKVFNNGEILRNINGDIVNENKLSEGKYQFIEKLNGFLGVISQDFYNRNKLLIHTSGSLDGPFTDYIKELLTDEQYINIVKFIKTKGKHTLMFEVIHPDDPHIVEYTQKDYGLYLIGARNLQSDNLANMKLLSEEELDSLANDLGFRRPKYFVEKYSDFKKRIGSEKIEGYMVRDLETGEHLVKIKFPYYLVTKFLARMGDGNFQFLLRNKEKFIEAKNIDEEFFPVVEYIAENKEKFEGMDEQEKVREIRRFIEEIV